MLKCLKMTNVFLLVNWPVLLNSVYKTHSADIKDWKVLESIVDISFKQIRVG